MCLECIQYGKKTKILHILQEPWQSPRSAKSNPRKRSNGGGTGLNLSILNNMDVLRNKLLRELMARNQASSCNLAPIFGTALYSTFLTDTLIQNTLQARNAFASLSERNQNILENLG